MISSGVPYWIDFGMVGRLSEANISSVQNLIFALVQEDTEALTDAALAMRTAKLPGLATDVLRNLSKGRLKISFELTGYEEPFRVLVDVIKNIVIAVFACVLFSGSCSLYSAQVPPLVDGIPLFALAGFAVSIALAIYSVKRLVKAAGKR